MHDRPASAFMHARRLGPRWAGPRRVLQVRLRFAAGAATGRGAAGRRAAFSSNIRARAGDCPPLIRIAVRRCRCPPLASPAAADRAVPPIVVPSQQSPVTQSAAAPPPAPPPPPSCEPHAPRKTSPPPPCDTYSDVKSAAEQAMGDKRSAI